LKKGYVDIYTKNCKSQTVLSQILLFHITYVFFCTTVKSFKYFQAKVSLMVSTSASQA